MKTKVVAVASGKGGVGKTNLCLNLSLCFTEMGKRVLLVDLDFGLANVEILLGIKPIRSLEHIKQTGFDFSKIITSCTWGLDFISGGRGFSWLNRALDGDLQKLLLSWRNCVLDYDLVFLDTPPSINLHQLLFLESVDLTLLVTTPEVTSVLDTYTMLKTLNNIVKKDKFSLIVNCCSNLQTATNIFRSVSNSALQYLNAGVTLAGFIPFDNCVQDAVKEREPFYCLFPASKASKSVRTIANSVLQELAFSASPIHSEV
ncbi:MAG: P-loop NTPase [Deltaproteobacteria bacterium]|nr:P-loop NTPase [Deltaproteobacteria bacterium]